MDTFWIYYYKQPFLPPYSKCMFRITVDSALLYYGFFELGSPFSSFHLFSFGARPEISPLVTVWAASHTYADN